MGVVRAVCAIAAVLVLAAVGEAATRPRDRLPPTRPTVDVPRETPDLRPVFHFGARDNRTPPSQIGFRCGNTTWFYLYSASKVHDPTLYLPLPEFHAFDSNNQAWNRGLTPEGFNVLPLVGVASAEMVFHPDRDSFAVLGWRSPYTGTVS